MLRHELRQSSLRLYADPQAGYWATPDAQCALMWLDATTVVMSDMRGCFTRRLLRELLAWVVAQGINTIHAERKAGHRLPCEQASFLGPNWRLIVVADLTTKT